MPRPVPPALTKAAVRVYGPGTTVRVTEHGGVQITDGWGTARLTSTERTAAVSVCETLTMLAARDHYNGDTTRGA